MHCAHTAPASPDFFFAVVDEPSFAPVVAVPGLAVVSTPDFVVVADPGLAVDTDAAGFVVAFVVVFVVVAAVEPQAVRAVSAAAANMRGLNVIRIGVSVLLLGIALSQAKRLYDLC
jgi:hypothetical protein